MGLIDKLVNGNSPLSNLNGGTPTIPDFAASKLHDEYSINSNPTVPGKPAPTILDGVINGGTPNAPLGNSSFLTSFSNGTYKDSAPEGRSF